MTVERALWQRFSYRIFLPKEVSHSILKDILRDAFCTPHGPVPSHRASMWGENSNRQNYSRDGRMPKESSTHSTGSSLQSVWCLVSDRQAAHESIF